MNLKIEKAQPEDISTLLPMMKDFYEIDGYTFDKTVTEKNFNTFINNNALGQCFILIEEDKTVGYMILNYIFSFEFGGLMCFLDELYVVPEAQGKKFGGEAVIFAQKFAKEKNFRMMFLEIENHNARAMHLYKKLGFEMHNREIMTYEPR